ncbi:type II CAAX prenyl endopeptidase Rce1 family protein [Kitasatospora sp. NPDC059088]|uniref:CPBP family glutamic-type intramembrane protease n=1 Tax=Kitasatospora sp. NPDC059088 TaxID=3346722 RepID=UPI0036743135
MPFVQRLLGALPDREPLPRPRAGQTGRAIAWSFAGPFALSYMAITIGAAWPGAQAAASGAAPSQGTSTAAAMLWASTLWLWLSLPAWLTVGIAERAPSVGLPRLSARQLLSASCSVFCLAEAPTFIVQVLFELARTHSPALASYSGGSGGSTLLGESVSSVAAGISEEIVVLVLPLLAAWRIGEVVTDARLRRFGLAGLVVVLTAARLSYHLEYGLAAIPLVPWAVVSVLLYRRSRAVLPLMAAHAGFDIVLALVNRVAARDGFAASVAAFAAVTAVALTTALGLSGRGSRSVAPAPGLASRAGSPERRSRPDPAAARPEPAREVRRRSGAGPAAPRR